MDPAKPWDALSAPAPASPRWEVADVFRAYGDAYRAAQPVPWSHRQVMQAIERCRTAALGGHLERCDTCDYERPAYNSCRNRHCPKCQALVRAQWLDARARELLPVGYFHNVFTLPHELNPLVLCNKRVLFNQLFASVSETLQDFGRRELGGAIGFTAILHTWDQKLLPHFHLHCVIPGGALSADGTQWQPCREGFLFDVKALSAAYRHRFVNGLARAFARRELQFPGQTRALAEPSAFEQLLESVRAKDWVVYSKAPLAGPEPVLDYLGRYTHRVAIGNYRLLDVSGGHVEFSYRDRRDGDTVKSLTVTAHEFIRRFLLHVVPEGLHRIRHFGFLANRHKRQKLGRCRTALGLDSELPPREPKTPRERMLELTGVDPAQCPRCGQGTLQRVGRLPPLYGDPCVTVGEPVRRDTS